jgi:hypothetical protein
VQEVWEWKGGGGSAREAGFRNGGGCGVPDGGQEDEREVPSSVFSGQQHEYDEVEAMACRLACAAAGGMDTARRVASTGGG